MSILIRLMQSKFKNKVQQSKWYAKVVSTGEIHTDELATIIESNTTFKKGEVQGLITELVDELKQQLSDGKTVVLDGFGRFHLTVESDLVAQQADFNIHQHIRRIKCKFLPAGNRLAHTGIIQQNFSKDVEVEWIPGKTKRHS